jgi:phosphoribosylanthranilate isomerase
MQKAQRPRIKVCGITRLEDAEALDAMGVDYLGFNFSPSSKRYVEPQAAASIIARLQHAEPVGVFVNAPLDRIHSIATKSKIRWAQLHGQEGWDILDLIRLPVIKAIPHTGLHDYGGLKAEWNKHISKPEFFLIDTQRGLEFGGSGQTFDWNDVDSHPLPLPFFLAGGLGPENLVAAVKCTRPYAVDLNSRVEFVPGIKDVELVKRCLSQMDTLFKTEMK